MARRRGRDKAPVLPWIAVAMWIALIWGHSLMPGSVSSIESSQFIELAQKAAYVVVQSHHPLVDQFVATHPNFVLGLADPDTVHFYVRKIAHFSEYFVLGGLVFNAVRLTFRRRPAGLVSLMAFWAGIPCVDEYIQLHIPNRAGQIRDVLIDMAGYGSGLAISLLVAIICAVIGGFFSLLFSRPKEPAWAQDDIW